MDTSSKRELEAIKRELDSIISEMESISAGVRKDFVGIGNDKCANCIDSITDDYKEVRRKLRNLDTNTVTLSYAQSHGDGC